MSSFVAPDGSFLQLPRTLGGKDNTYDLCEGESENDQRKRPTQERRALKRYLESCGV